MVITGRDKTWNLFRMATWNADKGFNTTIITKLMVLGQVDLLEVQEPWVKLTSGKKKRKISELERSGLQIVPELHQCIIIKYNSMGPIIVTNCSQMDGRIIQVDVDIKGNIVHIISLYGITNGQHSTYINGWTKNEVRTELFSNYAGPYGRLGTKHSHTMLL